MSEPAQMTWKRGKAVALGVPRSTAMAMVGHKTESIYRRYAIVDEAMHREAAAKLDVWAAEEKTKAAAERRGQIKRFKKQVVS
jgi:hypothetical protein